MISRASLELIKEFEGFRADAYRDPVGIWTIGYGTTAAAGVGITPRAGLRVTEQQAEAYLDAAVAKFADQIRPKITRPISDNQFGAFVSLAYNIGPAAFAKSSALRKFNAGDIEGAADAILLWNKAGGRVLRGLERRRAAERALFLGKPPALQPPKASPPASRPSLTPVPPKSKALPFLALIAAAFAALGKWFGMW